MVVTSFYEQGPYQLRRSRSFIMPKYLTLVLLVSRISASRTGLNELINSSRHLARKYARIFVHGHCLFREGKVLRERSSRETVSYEEQIISKDKYPSIFSPQMETIVFIILQISFATRAVLKIGAYSRIIQFLLGNVRSRDALRPIAGQRKDLMDYNSSYIGDALFDSSFGSQKYLNCMSRLSCPREPSGTKISFVMSNECCSVSYQIGISNNSPTFHIKIEIRQFNTTGLSFVPLGKKPVNLIDIITRSLVARAEHIISLTCDHILLPSRLIGGHDLFWAEFCSPQKTFIIWLVQWAGKVNRDYLLCPAKTISPNTMK